MDATNKLDLDHEWLLKLQCDFQSARITDEEMCSTMKNVYEKFGYLADPHTVCLCCEYFLTLLLFLCMLHVFSSILIKLLS